MIFPGKITAQGVALAPSRSDATGGSALDGDLDRQDNARRRWTGQPHSRGVSNCGPRGRVTAGHYRLGGSGDSRPASARRTRRASARQGRGFADAPGRGQTPAIPSWDPGPGGHPRRASCHFSALRVSCSHSLRQAKARRGAGVPLKWLVEKVVTAPDRLRMRGV